MPRHVFSDTHEWINEMPTVLFTIARIHSHGHINFLPFHVLSASHESRLTVSKPGRSQLSEVRLEGPQLLRTMRGQNTPIARAAYSAKECASSPPRQNPYGFMSPAERRLRLQRRRERSERNVNLALAERQEAWKDRLSVVQVNQLSVLTCTIPCCFLFWCVGRACTVLQGLSTKGQNFLP